MFSHETYRNRFVVMMKWRLAQCSAPHPNLSMHFRGKRQKTWRRMGDVNKEKHHQRKIKTETLHQPYGGIPAIAPDLICCG